MVAIPWLGLDRLGITTRLTSPSLLCTYYLLLSPGQVPDHGPARKLDTPDIRINDTVTSIRSNKRNSFNLKYQKHLSEDKVMPAGKMVVANHFLLAASDLHYLDFSHKIFIRK